MGVPAFTILGDLFFDVTEDNKVYSTSGVHTYIVIYLVKETNSTPKIFPGLDIGIALKA
jgi:hypothetical protein